jgi:hypothetical protein
LTYSELGDWADDLFFVQTAPKAVAFYDEKVKGLDANLQEYEKGLRKAMGLPPPIIREKRGQLTLFHNAQLRALGPFFIIR